jgi:polycystin 1L1
VYRFVLVGNIIELFRETYFEEFVDISFVAFWDHILRCLVGILIFLVTLTSLKLLRNHRCLAKLTGVFKKAALEISYVGAMFVIWLGAYTSLGTALFHSTVESFRSFWWGFSPVTGLMTGIYRFEEVSVSQEHWLRIFIVSFMMLAMGSLTSFMVAILSWNYKTYREDWLPSMTSLEALSYFWHKFLVITGFRHPWPYEDEDDNYLSPEFTMAEIEYQVDEMLFKMNALAGTSNLPEKPPIYFTDSDCTYNGNGDDGISTGSEERPFDDDRFTHRIHKIEDQLLVNEPHLACLLHLDSIGAEVLTEEREKQLRNQLELEIFRQLQMQRHGNQVHSDRTSGSSYQAHLTASHTNSGNSRNSTGSSDSGNSSSRNSTGGNSRKSNSSSGNISSSSGSSNASPSVHGLQRGNKPPFPKPPSLSTLVPDDMIPSDPIKAARLPNAGLVSPRDVVTIHANPKSDKSDRINIEMSQGLALQDLSNSCDNSKADKDIPLKTLEKSKGDAGGKKCDKFRPLAETRLQDDQTSGS